MTRTLIALVLGVVLLFGAVLAARACQKCNDGTCPTNACNFTNVDNKVVNGTCTSSFYNGCPCSSGGTPGGGC